MWCSIGAADINFNDSIHSIAGIRNRINLRKKDHYAGITGDGSSLKENAGIPDMVTHILNHKFQMICGSRYKIKRCGGKNTRQTIVLKRVETIGIRNQSSQRIVVDVMKRIESHIHIVNGDGSSGSRNQGDVGWGFVARSCNEKAELVIENGSNIFVVFF